MKKVSRQAFTRLSSIPMLCLVAVGLATLCPTPKANAVERIDPSFANEGAWIKEYWGDLLIKRDLQGRIVVLDPWRSPTVTRLLPDGQVDTGFGSGSDHDFSPSLRFNFSKRYQWGLSPALRDGLRPLIAASVGAGRYSTALYALTERGRLSMHFFDAGIKEIGNTTNAILPGPSGTTLMVGEANTKRDKPAIALISKIDRGTNLVDSFGKNGQIRLPSNKASGVTAAHQFGDISYVRGGLLVSGYLNGRLTLLKLTPRGRPRRGYGNLGQFSLPVRSHIGCELSPTNMLAIDNHGSGFVAGCRGRRDRDVIVAVNGSGSVKRSFGQGGLVDLDSLLSRKWKFGLMDLVRDRSGVLIAGSLRAPADEEGRVDFEGVLVRLTSDGSLDRRFGENGVFHFPKLTKATSIQKVSDGVVVGGHIQPLDHRTIFGVVTRVLIDR